MYAGALEAALASADVLVMLVDHNQFKAVSGDSVTRRLSSTPKECGGENHSGHRRRGLHWFGGSAEIIQHTADRVVVDKLTYAGNLMSLAPVAGCAFRL